MSNAIVYLHGFRSAPASIKAQQVQAAVAALPEAARPLLHIPALHDGPLLAIAAVVAWVEAHASEAPLTFIGSSLGGFYATWLAEHYDARAVVINPSVRPYDDLARWRGVQTNLYTGEEFEVTDQHFAELRALAVEQLRDPSRYFLLVRTGDELLDWRHAVARYAGGWQSVEGGGDHGFTDFARHLPEVLRFAGVDGAC
jgi:predicted esterase YcpF (UPF0227 family)